MRWVFRRIENMQRLVLTVVAGIVLYVGAATLAAPSRAPYDPFAMKRAAEAPQGSKERDDFERRKEIVHRLKDHVRPPVRPGTRSPHKPGDDDDHDRGHGNNDDHDDDDNPGRGNGNHGTGNNGNGNGNNGNGNGNNGNGRGNH